MRHVDISIRLWAKVDKRGPDECWPFTGCKTQDGYGMIFDCGKPHRTHRVAWILTNGPIPKNMASKHGTVVRHTCDNPICCNPAHLLLGTQADNIADRVARRRDADRRGWKNVNALFTPAQIAAIRSSKAGNSALAAKYGVHISTIYRARTGATYAL